MNTFFNNGLIRGVLVLLVVLFILGLFGWFKFRRDERIVTEFLRKSGVDTGDDCSSTQVISSATSLSEDRVRVICSNSSRVKRKHKDEDLWRLSD